MTRTVTALFDQRADAEEAVDRLKAAGLGAEDVRVLDKSSQGYDDASYSTHRQPGIWASIKNAFLPDEDRHTYEEGIRRGGYLVTADVDEARADEAVRVLEETDTVDIDDRAGQWASQGWARPAYANAPDAEYDRTSAEAGAEQSIPVVEEQLVVGKRELDRGGVRVRSYVTETPVHEQVRLRDERIDVERHAVDRPLANDAEDAFRERTIELTATGEEAVVSKTARVVEEVSVRKTSEEHVEEINDSVRKTEVEIDNDVADRRIEGEPPLAAR